MNNQKLKELHTALVYVRNLSTTLPYHDSQALDLLCSFVSENAPRPYPTNTELVEAIKSEMGLWDEQEWMSVNIPIKMGCECKDVEIGSYANLVELPTPAHMLALGSVGCLSFRETTCVDRCIADIVQALWAQGIVTTGCCCGHNKRDGYVGLYLPKAPRPLQKPEASEGRNVQLRNDWISVLLSLVEPMTEIERQQPGFERRMGWNDALRRVSDYLSVMPTAAQPADRISDVDSAFYPPRAMLNREDWDAATRKPKVTAAAVRLQDADELLDMLAKKGGAILRTASLDAAQIAAARIEGRMHVREDDCGFVHMPADKHEQPKDFAAYMDALLKCDSEQVRQAAHTIMDWYQGVEPEGKAEQQAVPGPTKLKCPLCGGAGHVGEEPEL